MLNKNYFHCDFKILTEETIGLFYGVVLEMVMLPLAVVSW